MADGNLLHFPTRSGLRIIEGLRDAKDGHLSRLHVVEQSPAGRHEFAPPCPLPVDRFELRAWADGYCIYERGDLICTFHGPQFELASKTLALLRDGAAEPTPPPEAA